MPNVYRFQLPKCVGSHCKLNILGIILYIENQVGSGLGGKLRRTFSNLKNILNKQQLRSTEPVAFKVPPLEYWGLMGVACFFVHKRLK